jgi:hypothetical protein
MMNDFLFSRNGADDSDIDALVERFNITEAEAEVAYRSWLDTLVE